MLELEPELEPKLQTTQAGLLIELRQAIAGALETPESAELKLFCERLEGLIAGQPPALQLQLAGTILLQLCELYAARFDRSISNWESQHQPLEPVVSLESCVDLFVQSLSLNLSELFEPEMPVQYPAHRQPASGSTAAEVDRASLLLLAQVAEPACEADLNRELSEQIQRLAHDENVEQWSARIRSCLLASDQAADHPPEYRFLDLQQQLQMPFIELWLGLLLGGYSLEQRGDFYSGDSIWVKAIT